MIYKAAMNLRDLPMLLEDEEGLPVIEMLRKIPKEWEQD